MNKKKTLALHAQSLYKACLCVVLGACLISPLIFADMPLYWWRPNEHTEIEGTNFGDELSLAIVERICGKNITRAKKSDTKLLAIGSIIQFAKNGDVVWGAGMNGKELPRKFHFKKLNRLEKKKLRRRYTFSDLDVRAVRGPLTRQLLLDLGIQVPEIYGDPALLLPILFPEIEVPLDPELEYIAIPHISEVQLFSNQYNVVFPTDPWEEIVDKIIRSRFVISSSLHGIIVAEAFGIPACFLRVTSNEPDFKYLDYYLGTGRDRHSFKAARSIEEALEIGGAPPIIWDADPLLNTFPYDCFD